MVKEIYELTPSDFDASPYWMFYAGPTGEYDPFTTVIDQSHPEYSTDQIRLIKSVYQLNNSQVLTGYFYENPEFPFQHTLFINNSSYCTWFGIVEPKHNEISGFYQLLNLTEEDVFPIYWHSVNNEYSGQLKGLGYLQDLKAVFVK
jgi:hypothetical protein